jgi:hypothetical protein
MITQNKVKNFNSFCGAEWLMGPKVIKTFMGLITTIVVSVSLLLGLVIFTVCLKGKLNSLEQKMKIDLAIDQIRNPGEDKEIAVVNRSLSQSNHAALDSPDNRGIGQNLNVSN